MRPVHAFAFVLATAVSVGATAQDQGGAAGAESLFDGQTLAGWVGDPAIWSVHDGCIRGSTVGAAVAHNTFLCSTAADVADFEFRARVRLVGDNNSGVQYRCRRLDGEGFRVVGYQCDVHAEPRYLGMLYEEGGRGIVAERGHRLQLLADGGRRELATPTAAPAVDLAQWHTLRIVARGTVLQHFVDEELAIEVHDEAATAARRGGLALQVHAGAPMTVWFRDLTLRRLPAEEVGAVASVPAVGAGAAPGSAAQWIWAAGPTPADEVFARAEVTLPQDPVAAQLMITADNHWRLEINGERLQQGDEWELPRLVDVTAALRAGRNAIAVAAWNDGGPAGLCAELAWTLPDGTAGTLVSDAGWRCATDDPEGWSTAAFAAGDWPAAAVLAPLGGGPWGGVLAADAFAELRPDPRQLLAVPAPELQVPPGWRAERLLDVPRAFGSWVCMCRDDRGRIYASDQARGLFRIELPTASVPARIERVDVDLGGCQGLTFAFGALYAVVNGERSGLYRLRDGDGDDRLDRVELLAALAGAGEHGPHAVVAAPDGEHLLVLCGNHTALPRSLRSRVPMGWRDDVLSPGIDDPNGHAVGVPPPGGYVCQVDRDGGQWELICCGFRNAYDLAVLASGDVVTFDADMEWDMGLPWYRPTRILQVLSGVDYGWRNGSRKWRTDWPDTLPAIADIGPGSPTGLVAGEGGALALDWTFGLVHAVGVADHGGGLAAAVAPFASGAPLPLTDVVAEPAADGRSYLLLTGGRGVRSKLYRVQAAADVAPAAPAVTAGLERRAEHAALAAFHGRVDAAALDRAWPYLGAADAVLRHAARIAVESQPVASWRARALAVAPAPPTAALTAWLALARQGGAEDIDPLLAALTAMPFAALDQGQRLAWLRVHALLLLRLGPIGPARATALGERLLSLFPTTDERVDEDLAALLAFLEVPGLLARALPLLAPMRPAAAPPWAGFVERNRAYGGAIAAMLARMPPTGQLAIADALRSVQDGWTPEHRRAYLEFLAAARQQRGGASYRGYLRAMADAVWRTAPADEQAQLAVLAGRDGSEPAEATPFRAVPPRGPGRVWSLAEAQALVRGSRGAAALRDRDLASGHNLFFAVGCASCHRFAGAGGGTGPDLTSLANKFTAADVLEAVLEPSRVVSDQFAGSIVTLRDGRTLFGRVQSADGPEGPVYEIVEASVAQHRTRVAVRDVVAVAPAPTSLMPAGLCDPLAADELLDLVAFLLSRGDGGGRR